MTCCVTMATKTASTPKHNKMTAAHCWSVHCLGSARMEALDSESRTGVSRWRGSGVGVLKWVPGEKGPWMSAAEPSLLSRTAQTRTWYSVPGSSPSSLKWVLGPRYTCHKNMFIKSTGTRQTWAAQLSPGPPKLCPFCFQGTIFFADL